MEARTASARSLLSVRRPSVRRIRTFVKEQRTCALSYDLVGATREIGTDSAGAVRGDYYIDAARVGLGRGHGLFQRAKSAVRQWRMFELGWLELCWPDTRLCAGSAVAILVHLGTGYALNAARIVYVEDEVGDVERFGFAYGTLPGHMLRGEERFTVTWDRRTEAVSFELVAVSRPSMLASWLSYPLVRALQRRFRDGALSAFRAAL